MTFVPPAVALSSEDRPLPRGRDALFLGFCESSLNGWDRSYRLIDMEYFLDPSVGFKIIITPDVNFPFTLGVPFEGDERELKHGEVR